MNTTPNKQGKDSEIIAKRVASWRKEIARLQDLIQSAEPGAQDEIASRINAELGKAFHDDPVSACRAQDAIQSFMPNYVAPVMQAGVPDGWRAAIQKFVDRCDAGEVLSRRTYAEFKELPAAPIAPQAVAASDIHDDDIAIDNFANAMKDKMKKCRAKGYGGWQFKTLCTDEYLAAQLMTHTQKGDPVDVANFAMMLHQRCDDTDITALVLRGAALDFAKRVAPMFMQEAPQPIAAPADPHWHNTPQSALGGKTAREGYAANPDYSSQQPVPALSDISTAEKALKWFKVLSKCATLLGMPNDQPIIEVVDVLAAQLVQQRATLSNTAILAEIEIVRDALGLTSLAFLTDGAAIAFARAILAAGAK